MKTSRLRSSKPSQRKLLGIGLIDALLAFLFLSPALFLYAKTQVSQRVNLVNSSEINQAVSLGENTRLALIAKGREILRTQPNISDTQFGAQIRGFANDLNQYYSALRQQVPCNQKQPMMSWTGASCSTNQFNLNLSTQAFSVAEKGQPITINITWADQTGRQNYSVRALVGKY